jgi:hypothetical protein
VHLRKIPVAGFFRLGAALGNPRGARLRNAVAILLDSIAAIVSCHGKPRKNQLYDAENEACFADSLVACECARSRGLAFLFPDKGLRRIVH